MSKVNLGIELNAPGVTCEFKCKDDCKRKTDDDEFVKLYFQLWDHPFSAYVTFSEKLSFLTP